METMIRPKISELDNSLVERIKSLFASNQDAVLTISIAEHNEFPYGKNKAYLESLQRSIDDLENNRNLISFTMEELEAYTNSKKLGEI